MSERTILVLTKNDIMEMVAQCFQYKDRKNRAICIANVGWVLVKAAQNSLKEPEGKHAQ